MSLDPLLLRGAQRAIESAALSGGLGDHQRARHDAELARDLLEGALREDDFEGALRAGYVHQKDDGLFERLIADREPLLSSERDTRPSDDGEERA